MSKKNRHIGLFAIILILNIAVESMFEVRGGVNFFALFNTLLLLRTK